MTIVIVKTNAGNIKQNQETGFFPVVFCLDCVEHYNDEYVIQDWRKYLGGLKHCMRYG